MGTGVLLQMPKGGSWPEVAWVVFLIFVAIAALAAGLQGWLIKKTNLLERALLVVAGVARDHPRQRASTPSASGCSRPSS